MTTRSAFSAYPLLAPFTCLLLVLAFSVPRSAHGQLLQGTINGNVIDSSQAVIVGAKVSARNEATNFVRETTTNSAGFYTLPDMPPGSYSVTIQSPSFQTSKRTGVIVEVQTVTRVDTALEVGTVNQEVTVAASAATLQTDRADVRAELGAQTLANLPVPIGRNYQLLFTTLPGVSPPASSHSFTANGTRSLAFSVNGGGLNSNDTRVDGAGTRNFNATDTIEYIPAMEAIETVNMATSTLDADQSSGAGYVNVTVKSGTNSLHGSVFWDYSNQDLAAYQWAANRTLPRLPYTNDQFGGTLGGPIKKDKVFYFFSYEGTRLVQGNAVPTEVPTAAMKTGNLAGSPTAIYDPLTGAASGTGRTPFPGNIIPASRIDSGVQALIGTNTWPNPNQAGTGALGLGNDFLCNGCQGNSGANRNQFDGKISWNPTTRLSAFARLGEAQGTWYNPAIFGNLLGGIYVSPTNISIGTGGSHVYNGTVSASYVFTPNLFVDAYFGYDRLNSYEERNDRANNYGWTLMGIPGLSTAGLSAQKQVEQGGMPYLVIDGFGNLGPDANNQPQNFQNPEKNFSASINWLKGTHNVRAGFEGDVQDSSEVQYQLPNGSSTYMADSGGFHFTQGTTQLSGGPAGNDYNAFGSFLLGMPQDSGKIYVFPDRFTTHATAYSAYLRDRWQIAPKLTLSYGVRADFFPFPKRADTGLEVYNPYTTNMQICGTGATPLNCGITKDRLHIVPRLGLAYRITDSTVVRAGYGIATDPIFFLGYTEQGRLNYPYIEGQTLLPPNSYSYGTTLRQGIPTVTPPNTSSGVVPVPANVVVTTFDNGNYVRGYVESYNLTLEQRVKSWLFSAGYVGSRAVDQQDNLQENWSPIGGGAAGEQLNKLTGRTASTLYLGTLGTNKYDSLQMRAQGHFGGYRISASYTFSKAMGYAFNPTVQIPQYYHLNYGPLATDVTQMFAVSGIAELPFGKGKRWAQDGLAAKIAGGWQMTEVVSARTGLPFTPTASTSSLNATFSSQFADCVGTPSELGNVYGWYAASAFAVPSSGRFGTCGTDSLRQPGLVNADVGLERRFRLTEKLQLTVRGEMFNLANTPHHSIPSGNTSVNSSTFLQMTSIVSTGRDGVEQRDVRFSLRVGW
ncbi:MAG: carboxypeptidase regulatory-like domain-containing protein [Bryobacteraceae bacterium]